MNEINIIFFVIGILIISWINQTQNERIEQLESEVTELRQV